MSRLGGRDRVLAVAVLIAVVTGVAMGAVFGWHVALGYFGGAVVGAGMLAALLVCVNKLVVPAGSSHGPRWPYLLLHLGKFVGAVALAWLLVGVLKASVAGFAVGYLTSLIGFLVVVNTKGRAADSTG